MAKDSARLAFARIGIDALIDEATGYEKIRNKNALRKKFSQLTGLGEDFIDTAIARLDEIREFEAVNKED